MGASTFSGQTSITIKAGQIVAFIDPSSTGGFHHLVTGTGGAFKAAAGAPTEFATASGQTFSPGTTLGVTFPNAGTFPITCTIHPSMQATVTVTS
jgi:plastocyanin